jgi:hypothetical protein
MDRNYSSQTLIEHAEELEEIGMGFNSVAAELLRDYAALLAKTERDCTNCSGLGLIQVAEGSKDDYWNCPHCHKGVVQYDPTEKLYALRDTWAQDASEYLNTWGQHMPASLDCLVEQLDEALKPITISNLRGKYKGRFSTIDEFLKDRYNEHS